MFADTWDKSYEKSLIKAAKKGSVIAQTKLGRCYEWHRYKSNIQKAIEKTIFWYSKAAEQGNPEAQVALGYYYEFGIGLAQDSNKAIFWYTKAAEQGDKYAQYRLKWYDYDKTHIISNNSSTLPGNCEKSLRDRERRAYYDDGVRAEGYRRNFADEYFNGSHYSSFGIDGVFVEKNQEKAIFWAKVSGDEWSLRLLNRLNIPLQTSQDDQLCKSIVDISISNKDDKVGKENQINTTIQKTKLEPMNLKESDDLPGTCNTPESTDIKKTYRIKMHNLLKSRDEEMVDCMIAISDDCEQIYKEKADDKNAKMCYRETKR